MTKLNFEEVKLSSLTDKIIKDRKRIDAITKSTMEVMNILSSFVKNCDLEPDITFNDVLNILMSCTCTIFLRAYASSTDEAGFTFIQERVRVYCMELINHLTKNMEEEDSNE